MNVLSTPPAARFLGVLGGMGPLATADFLAKLVAVRSAPGDQSHLPVLVWGDCEVPDRTAALTGQGPSPLPALLAGARFLDACGVGAICMPCNTAHHWIATLQQACKAPWIDMVQACVERIQQAHPAVRAVGVLTTAGAALTDLYPCALRAAGWQVVTPTQEAMARWVTPGIERVKAHQLAEAAQLLTQAADDLRTRGAEVTVLGCTEIPVALASAIAAEPHRFIDATSALARAAHAHFEARAVRLSESAR
jgi:aspartate racemase